LIWGAGDFDAISHGVLTAIRLPDQRIYQSARYQIAKPDA
jgi:hypothetical protein